MDVMDHAKAPARMACLLLIAAPLSLPACDRVSQDLNDVTSSFFPPSPAEAARMMLDPYDPDRRREGTTLISNAPFGGEEIYLSAYRDNAQNESDPLVKASGLNALGRHGSPEDGVILAENLKHENVQVRWAAARALQRIHNPAAVRPMLASLGDVQEHVDVRMALAVALGQYPEESVFQGLVAALSARELALNLAAERSLELVTGQELGNDPRAWLAWRRSTTEPFAGQRDYLFPTYSRKPTFVEWMTFWNKQIWEQPAPPAGLRPVTQRDTYPTDAEASPE